MKRTIAFGIAASGLVVTTISVIAIVTNAWLFRQSPAVVLDSLRDVSYEEAFGLWNFIEESPSLTAIRTLVIIGADALFLGSAVSFGIAWKQYDKALYAVILFVFAGLSTGFGLVVFSVSYNTVHYNNRVHYGYSYVLSWISVVFSLFIALTTALFH